MGASTSDWSLWNLYYTPGVHLGRRRTFAGSVTGVALRDFTQAAAERFGSLADYASRVVVPALLQQGLLEQRTIRRLLTMPTRRTVLTTAGEVKRAELQQTLRLAERQGPDWAANDPMMGMQYAMFAGSAMLLMPELRWDQGAVDQMRNDWSAADAGAAGGTAINCQSIFERIAPTWQRREHEEPKGGPMPAQHRIEYPPGTNPLFNDNRLKLGIFGGNVSHGCAISTAEGGLEMTWPNVKSLAVAADRAGFEAFVPVARWKGFGGPSDFNGTCFETYTWAAGLAEATDHMCILATSHVPTVNPVMAAKQVVTIDHISNGRFGLNVVCGWFEPEFQMFGLKMMDHESRYAYAGEWLDIMKQLWTSEQEFNYDGKFLHVKDGFALPKPVQRPHPPIMNAGQSETGQRFAARYGDMVFCALLEHNDFDVIKAQVDRQRALALEFGREPGIWANTYVVCRATEKEARDYLNYYVVEKGDNVAVDNRCNILGLQSGSIPAEMMEGFKYHLKAGWGGYPLVGTPEQIVEKMQALSSAGIDGILLSWLNYEEGLQQWNAEVMPLMEQAGLRKSYARVG